MSDEKVHIQFVTLKSLRDKFQNKCKGKAINPSEWLRQQVEKFVKEEK